MKVGIIGTGNIGGMIARKLKAAGHNVRVANSRGNRKMSAHWPVNSTKKGPQFCLG
jgi:predicted dinucleotide-binding enzyme